LKLQVDVRGIDEDTDLMDLLDAVGDALPDQRFGGTRGSFEFQGADVLWELLVPVEPLAH
jgi:hypothetical protein